MIRKFIITTSVILTFSNLIVNSQDIISGEGIFKVCNAGNKTTKIYISSQSNFQPRTFDIRIFTNFKPRDTLFLRFRLFSDPYAHGWGWAVDDLKIKSVSAGVESISLDNSLKLYPNPGNGIIYVNITSDNPFEKISYSISNITGTTIKAGNLPVNGTFVLNLTGQNSGIYFIKNTT